MMELKGPGRALLSWLPAGPSASPGRISLLAIGLFLFFYILGGYIYSYNHGEISLNAYDANIALAYGNKPLIIIGSTIAFGLLVYLMMLNKHQSKLYIRIFLLVLIYALIQALLWINPSTETSIILGGITLAAMRMFVIMTCIAMLTGASKYLKYGLIGMITLAAIGVCLQISFAYGAKTYYEIIHPGLENYVILLFLITIFILGFV